MSDITELVDISRQAYHEANLLDWQVDQLVAGVEAALQTVPADLWPSAKLWSEYFPADARQTARFIMKRRDSTIEMGMAWAVADVCHHWKKQATLVCEHPELLACPYQERARILEAKQKTEMLVVA